jgi:hypothetical protein
MGNGRVEFAKGDNKTANYRERRKLAGETKQELNRLGVGEGRITPTFGKKLVKGA